MEQTKTAFRGRRIRTTRQLLLDTFLKDLAWKAIGEEEEYFIDPDVQLENGQTVHDATKFLISWFGNKASSTKSTALSILTANGGVGKTTVSRILCGKIRSYDSSAIPILVESDQWRHLLQTTITLDTLLDLAVSRRFERAGSLLANKTAMQVLIREGLFVVVFDGFDELCVNPSSMIQPRDVIAELVQLLTPEDEIGQARILLTARETYWETIRDEIDEDKVEIFRLKGFDNEQKKRYFDTRLQDNAERGVALRIAKQIGGGMYDSITPEDQNQERFSGVPFILDLIARYVHENSEVPQNPYKADPLHSLLEDICRRESRRQTLDLDPGQQFTLFEELFREFQDSFSVEDLKLYLGVICGVTDPSVISRFTNHVFLTRIDKDRYGPRYEVLRVYFVAHFLANSLGKIGEKTQRQKIARILAENSTGKTQLIDWLVHQLRSLERTRLKAAFKQALEIINDRENETVQKTSAMALFHIAINLIEGQDKKQKTKELAELYEASSVNGRWKFNSITLTGGIRGFDFSGCDFVRCCLIASEFKNCLFDADTAFKNCEFEATLTFSNCSGANEIRVVDSIYSKEAEYVLDKINDRGTRPEVKRAFAEDALNRALKKFRGNFGLTRILFRHRRSGFKVGNPFNDGIWDALLKRKIVQQHLISGVDEGGLNVHEDKELRREITSFLDNGVLGPRLRDVVNDLIE